jgi:hypothetical protein
MWHLYPQTLSLTSPTSGSRSVGIVSLLTETTEFVFFLFTDSNGQFLKNLEITKKELRYLLSSLLLLIIVIVCHVLHSCVLIKLR